MAARVRGVAHAETHDVAPRLFQPEDLLNGILYVARAGGGHALHGDGRAAAYDRSAYGYSPSHADILSYARKKSKFTGYFKKKKPPRTYAAAAVRKPSSVVFSQRIFIEYIVVIRAEIVIHACVLGKIVVSGLRRYGVVIPVDRPYGVLIITELYELFFGETLRGQSR